MHIPINIINTLFIVLKVELSESKLSLKIGLIIAIDEYSFFSNIYIIKI